MENIVTGELKGKKLILRLCGRVDSSNSPQVEKEIADTLEGKAFDEITVDAAGLEYISSAGLRVILRLRKSYPGLEIINTSPEVYEIFEMTGFTEMMPIGKAYRVLSVEGCEVIGKGSNGEVYRLDPDTIIKVYLNPDALPEIHRERELARKAFVMGIPTAIPYDVVRVGEGYGSVFELLNAKSFTKILSSEPQRLDEITGMYVNLLKVIHSTQVKEDDMPCMKKIAMGWVSDIKGKISDRAYEKLYSLVSCVPEDNHIIHGDYHVKNVMLQNGEALLIDMDTLCHGAPVFEFASIFNAYIGFYGGIEKKPEVTFIGIPYEMGLEIWSKTLRLYFNTDDEELLKEIEMKAAVVGYTRVLRRTYKRSDMTKSENKAIVEYCKNKIEEYVEKIDTLCF